MPSEGDFWVKTGAPVGSEPAWNRCYWWKGGYRIGQSLPSLQWKWENEREREWISCIPRELKRQTVWKSETLQYRQPVRVREASARPDTYTDTHRFLVTCFLPLSLTLTLFLSVSCVPYLDNTKFMQTCILQQFKNAAFCSFSACISGPATLKYACW